MRDFCLLGSLRGRGWLRGDVEQRDKRGRAAGIAPGTALGSGRDGPTHEGGGLRLGTFAVLSQLQKGSSLLINFGKADRS